MRLSFEQKRHRLFIVLAGIFITNALIAEMIGGKIFSLEKTMGIDPMGLNIFGFVMDFNLTAGVMIWPVVFITSDLINEYFGKPGVKTISYLTAALIAYAFIVIFVTMHLSPADFWLNANNTDPKGNAFDVNFAFNKIFSQGQRIIIGSIAAFLLGQLTDVFVFQKLRKMTGAKKLWLRATGSTLVSQLIDSYVVLFIAFYGNFETSLIIAIGITNYIYKFIVAIVLTPVIYAGHSIIDNYLGKSEAAELSESAAKQSGGFF